jgi:hypothetical protein
MRLLGRSNWWAPGPLLRIWRRYGIHEAEPAPGLLAGLLAGSPRQAATELAAEAAAEPAAEAAAEPAVEAAAEPAVEAAAEPAVEAAAELAAGR